ncbi:peroxidase 1-like [Phragmites australis]|uniref:peroxidase 1-like n=1 Tax=Phragmites australis TaxID=29695 RepID=UPI002D79B830|nr:peroxidase 1-like [Phragmites australis]
MAAAAMSRMRSLAGVAPLVVAAAVLVVLCSGSTAAGPLEIGFYNKTCPAAEEIVRAETARIVRVSPDLAAAFLRLHYHDCFVQGCDASVLLDSTPNNTAEKDSKPNGSLRGFDFVARVKDKLEKACPGVVSCADILAIMARDAVMLARGPSWPVALGRRDSRTSSAGSCGDLPPLHGDIALMIQSFAAKGLDVKDLVVLSGAHTLGKAYCPAFADRLYATAGYSADPALDSRYADRLRMRCTSADDTSSTAATELDPGSCTTFDTSYYRHVARRRGLLRSDAFLLDHRFTRAYVLQAATGRYDGHFFHDFAVSMAKMGSIGVLTGDQGEIRKKCNVVN